MTRAAIAAAGMLLAAASLSAHRLDEYLQAARVTLGRSEVALEIDLTPGASVADRVIALVDRDGDNIITPVEAESYGRAVLDDVLLELDGSRADLALRHVEVPSIDEMKHGMGTIQLRATADLRHIGPRPQLRFRNNHQPDSSVYLVNALIPTEHGISVVRQTRDAHQRDVRIDYTLSPLWLKYAYWPLVAGIALFFIRRRSTRSIDP